MARDPAPDLNLHGKAWLAFGIGPQRERPTLHRMTASLSQARLALLTTGGFVPPGGEPFNTGKRGDASFREIDRDIEPARLEIHHPHYDAAVVKRDINVLFPLPLCRELIAAGKLGKLADRHYSFMGYVPLTRPLEKIYAPQVAQRLKQQEVDAVLLTPA